MEARLAERGLVLRAAFENEFSLAHAASTGQYVPVDSGAVLLDDRPRPRRRTTPTSSWRRSRRRGSCVEQYYAELGHGQQEISTAHAPALQAADEQLLVRETIRGVAARHGLVASLGAEAVARQRGQRLPHPLLAVGGRRRNRFYDAAASDDLSGEAVAFLAGVLEHLPGLCGLTAPSFNSYHRIVPQYWAGAFACWGHDNREAPMRVPSVFRGAEEASTNAELKASDATCNPYLALGGLIAAGLDGLERGLELPEPVEVDPATLSEEEREERGIRRLPATQAEALDALAADDVLIDALGPVLAGSYLAVRRSEWAAYSAEDEAFEQQGHFAKY